jgi:hypothetical protein
MIEIDGLEILVLLQVEPVEHEARHHGQTGTLCTEGNRFSDKIADGLVGTVCAHHEHSRARIHRGENFQARRGTADALEGFIGGLAGDQRKIE